jgi:hypothetical protein
MSVLDDVVRECYGTKPPTLSKLLRELAMSEPARENSHDTILIGAAAMMDAFDRRRPQWT